MDFSPALNATIADLREIPEGERMLSQLSEMDGEERLRRSRLLVVTLGVERGMSSKESYGELLDILDVAARIKLLDINIPDLIQALEGQVGEEQLKDLASLLDMIRLKKARNLPFFF